MTCCALRWRSNETTSSRMRLSNRVKQVVLSRIDLRENVMDFPNQPIITRDNVEIQVCAYLHSLVALPLRAGIRVSCILCGLCILVPRVLCAYEFANRVCPPRNAFACHGIVVFPVACHVQARALEAPGALALCRRGRPPPRS